jgi:hypothetical protein
MKRIVCIVCTTTLLAFAGKTPAWASDPIGIYALIDKVVLEPNAEAPTRIQVWGAFTFAKEAGGNSYAAPVRGYLYYRVAEGKEDVCRKEWADMKKIAGTGEVIGMGSSFDRTALGSVRGAYEKAEKPDAYPLGMGLVRIRRGTDYTPIQSLITLPAPTTPADGSTIDPGKVTLTTRNIAGPGHARAKYVFELENGSGEKETSDPIAAGEKETKWTPRMPVKAGEKYTWRVGVVEARWKGPLATSTFQGKARP